MLHSRPSRIKRDLLSHSNHEPVREIALREGLRVWAEINLDRVAENVRVLVKRADHAKLLAVVKGNGYGHGAVAVAREAIAAGAWGLGVIDVLEGEELRRAGLNEPILVLGSSAVSVAPRLVASRLRPTIGSLEMGLALSRAAVEANDQAIVHIKIETGLNRYGLEPGDVQLLAEQLRRLPNIKVEGLSTHLASVDEGDKTFTHQQYETFRACAENLPWIPIQHVSSTGAVLDLPELCLGLVRCGIGIYGYYPSDEVGQSVHLAPALSLRSRIGRELIIEAGASVGYGRTWTAPRRSRIALVMAGYADGLPRALSNRGVVLIRGQRAPVVGRVAMDMHIVDITDIHDAKVDDEVTLIGEQEHESIWASEVGSFAETISYEILAGITARVTRLFLKSGKRIAIQDLAGYREVSAP